MVAAGEVVLCWRDKGDDTAVNSATVRIARRDVDEADGCEEVEICSWGRATMVVLALTYVSPDIELTGATDVVVELEASSAMERVSSKRSNLFGDANREFTVSGMGGFSYGCVGSVRALAMVLYMFSTSS